MNTNVKSKVFAWILMTALAPGACSANPPQTKQRPPVVAGQFYPEEPSVLRESVDQMLSQAKHHDLKGNLVAMLVPHAGYIFSGSVAAEGFKSIGTNWTTIVMLGPSHQVSVKTAAVFTRGTFETSLGKIPVNEVLAGRLVQNSSLFEDSPEAHLREHSLEVELPFLQRTLKNFKIVPILINTEDPAFAKKVGEKIAQAIKALSKIERENTLILISSDLSHYPPRQTARLADTTFLRALESMDPEYAHLTSQVLLNRGEPNLETVCCGQAALMAGLYAAKCLGADHATLLQYMNSGEIKQNGDPLRTVGYAAMAFVKSGHPPRTSFLLDGPSKQRLLATARSSISEAFKNKRFVPESLDQNVEMNLPAAVFVTLQEHGQLRGCIGTTVPQAGLLDAVRYFARAAAFEDPRFRPLERSELNSVHIEISILSAPQPVQNADAIVPGKHGVIVRKGNRSGLFLPTVWEQLPQKEEFLSRLCTEKAGLSADCWKDPSVELRIFTSDVFEEKQ